jgi:vitamin B12 transporter
MGIRISTVIAIILSAGALAGASLHASAQGAGKLPETVVTATRIATPIEEVASSLTVITAEDMERRQQRTVVEALAATPGLRVVQLGGPGRQTSVFARGANSNQTLVLIDGLEAGDPSAPGGAFDFAHLVTDNIERIEVVRGPQSTLYGSDAIGAVINIITKRGTGKPSATARMEYGSFNTVNPSASLRGVVGAINFSGSVSALSTEGESVSAPRVRPAGAPDEADGYDNLTASVRIGADIGDRLSLSVINRYVRTDADIDPSAEDPNAHIVTNQYFARIEAKGLVYGEIWESTLGLNYTYYRRKNSNDPDSLSTTQQRTTDKGIKYKAEWQNDFRLTEGQTTTLGAEVETEDIREDTNTDFGGFQIIGTTDANVDNRAFYLQHRYSFFDRISGTVGIRRDRHQAFGSETTYRLSTIYRHRETGTTLKASLGTGFRAPALFELFGKTANNFGGTFNGNPGLLPEKSRGWEAGFEQTLMRDRVKFGAVYFDNRVDNLIVCGLTTCNNTSRAESSGAESFVSYQPLSWASVRIDYTYTRAEDVNTGADLLRRPKHKLDAELVLNPTDRLRLGFTASYIGSQKDVSFTTGARVSKGGYPLYNVSGSYRLNDRYEAFARVENLLDREFEVADGFQGSGLRGFIGVRVKF